MSEGSIPAGKRGECSVCRRSIWRSATSAAVQVCRECRAIPRHGASEYRAGCRCDVCRAGAAERMRAYAEKRRREGKPATSFVLANCVTCGGEFNSRRRAGGSYTRNCSRSCSTVEKNMLRGFAPRPPRKSAFRRRAEKLAARAAEGTSGGARTWVQGACAVCGGEFVSPGAASRYCSSDCRQKNRRSRSFGLTWLDRMALFARDEWLCMICGLPTDYTADPGSNWYPTLDHIVPQAHGGSHDPSNLRTAHMWCNSKRGDLSHCTDEEIRSLIGGLDVIEAGPAGGR